MERTPRGGPKHLPKKGTKGLTFTTAEDESNTILKCDTCSLKSLTAEANAFCLFCKRYLCTDCELKHKSATSTEGHVVLTGKEMQSVTGSSTSRSRIYVDMCAEHSYRMIEFFCPKHEDVFCVECKTNKHNGCANVAFIKQLAKGIKADRELPKVLENVRNTMMHFERLRNLKLSQQERIEEQMHKCIKDVTRIREKLNEGLERLEKSMRDTIGKVFEKEISDLKEERRNCDSNVSFLQEHIESLNAIKTSDEIKVFVTILKAKQSLLDRETNLNYLTTYRHEMKYEVEHNQELFNFIRESNNIGTIKTTYVRPNGTEEDKHDMSVRIPTIIPHTGKIPDMVICAEHTIGSKEDIKHACLITGSLFLPDGRLILCDNRNNYVKIFDSRIHLENVLKFSKPPYDLAGLKNREVVITIPDSKELHFVKIDPNPRVKKVVIVKSSCHGICYHRDGLLATCFHHGMFGMVLLLDMEGNVKQRIERDVQGDSIFRGPFYIAANPFDDKFYVTDKAANLVVGLTMGGKVLFRYFSDELEGPGSICLDKDGMLYICGRDSKNIHVITPCGKKLCVINSDGGLEASSLGYRSTDGIFVLAVPNSDTLKTYKLI